MLPTILESKIVGGISKGEKLKEFKHAGCQEGQRQYQGHAGSMGFCKENQAGRCKEASASTEQDKEGRLFMDQVIPDPALWIKLPSLLPIAALS